ncbi:MAG: hypothetical protein Q9187_004040, partial [Circinaria calcarea]
MSGIPIFTESPISPSKATAITPQTTALPQSPFSPAAAATPTATATSSYPPAQPGSSLPTSTQPSTSTKTITPPPPQPGALPTPSTASSRSPSPRRDIPPPPRVGEKAHPPSYYAPQPTPTPTGHFVSPQPFPPQMSFPSPSDPRPFGQPPASTTLTSNNLLSPPQSARIPPFSPSSPTGDISTRKSLEHPPGYVQNPYAADMTPEQRFATQKSPGSPSLGYGNG